MKKEETYSQKETVQRRDETIVRMLNTPPILHAPLGKTHRKKKKISTKK